MSHVPRRSFSCCCLAEAVGSVSNASSSALVALTQTHVHTQTLSNSPPTRADSSGSSSGLLCLQADLAERQLPDMEAVRRAQQASRRVVLNVGGVRHECLWSTLERLPKSRLARLNKCCSVQELLQLCDDFDIEKGEYFFDRHAASFAAVLNFYRTSKLHLLDEICVMTFSEDLEYWDIDEVYLEPCCVHKYHQRKDSVLEDMRREEDSSRLSDRVEDFGHGCLAQWKKSVWYSLEKPQTSKIAKVSAT